jgi:MFS family permease
MNEPPHRPGTALRGRLRRALDGLGGGLPRAYWWLWTGMLVNRVGGFIVAYLALYLTERRGLTPSETGLVVALYGAGAALAGPVAGVLTDRAGRRPTMLLSLSLGGTCAVALGLAEQPASVAALVFATGFVGEMYRPPVQAAVADLVAPADRARAYGLLYWAVNLGFSLGFTLGGLLATVSWVAVFAVDGLTTLAFAAVVWRRVPETRPAGLSAEHPRAALAGALRPLADRVYAPFLLLNFLVALVFFQFQLVLPLDMRAHGLGPAAYGALLSLNGIVIVLVQPAASRWLTRFDRSRVMAAAALLLGTGFGTHGLMHSAPAYALAIVVWTLGEIANHPVASALAADLSPAPLRGRHQGAFSLSWALAFLAAPALGGAVLSSRGAGAVWAGSFALMLLVAAGQLRLGPARRRRLAELAAAGGEPPPYARRASAGPAG